LLWLPLQIAAPFGVAEFDIMFGRGINALGCVLDAAEVTQVVERKVRALLSQCCQALSC
jgi:hypothetical protein